MRNLLKESDTRISGNPISFIDIDETTMHTFAKVNVMKDGEVVKSLDNQEFNTHELGDGETYNFDNFRDAKFFNKTSKPIEKTINRIKNIIQSIKDNKKQEKVIFLTARSDFDDKEVFLDTFRNFGIDVDIPNVYIERSGNLTNIKNVADRKKYVILKYLKSGLYTAAKMYDDDKKNLQTFEELGQEVNSGKYGILDKIKDNFPKINKINFYPLLVTNSGKIKAFESEENDENILLEEINAYHGSHKNFDNFDTKFIGSGEQCQAHGWGLYFALNPDIAKNYHTKISGYHDDGTKNKTDVSLTYNGKNYPPNTIQGIMIKKLYNHGKQNTLEFLKNLSKESQFSKNPEQFKENVKRLYTMVNSMDSNKIKESIKVNKGQYYTVSIPDLNTYLDENKLLREQSPEVINICKNILLKLNSPFKAKNINGREFYNKLKYYSLKDGDHYNAGANNAKEVSNFLYDNGITGIKYNGGTDGNCVVIFNKNDVKIIKKDVEYGSTQDGLEMSEITKFIDDPKKLKGKRVKPEIIDWFVENRPELISSQVYNEKLDDEQKVKFIVYSSLIMSRNPVEELEKSGSNLPELPIALILCLNKDVIQRYEVFDKNDFIKLIDRIPLETKIKYINKCGTNCFENIFRWDKIELDDKIDIINEFFKGVKIEDIDLSNLLKANYIYIPRDSYSKLSDVIKYAFILCDIKIKKIIYSDEIIFDNVAIKCMKENKSDKDVDIEVNGDNFNIDLKMINQFKELLKYNPNGYYYIRFYTNKNDELYRQLYTDDIIETFKNCEYKNIPSELNKFLRENPSKYKLFDNKVFQEIISNDYVNDKLFEEENLKELGMEKVSLMYDYYITKIEKIYNGARLYDYLIKIIKSGFVNDKKSIIDTAKFEPELLRYYNNIPYSIQKIICSKNPYMIKFISNPDKNLIKELSIKIPNINDYLDNGE